MDNGGIRIPLVDVGWKVGVGWIMEVLVFHWWIKGWWRVDNGGIILPLVDVGWRVGGGWIMEV